MLHFWNMKCQKAICPLALAVRYKPHYVYCNLENEGRKRQLSRDPQGRSQTLVILRLRNTCLSCLSFATHSQPPFIKAMRHPSFLPSFPFILFLSLWCVRGRSGKRITPVSSVQFGQSCAAGLLASYMLIALSSNEYFRSSFLKAIFKPTSTEPRKSLCIFR